MTCIVCQGAGADLEDKCRGYRVKVVDACMCGKCPTTIVAGGDGHDAFVTVPAGAWKAACTGYRQCFTDQSEQHMIFVVATGIVNHWRDDATDVTDLRDVPMQQPGRG